MTLLADAANPLMAGGSAGRFSVWLSVRLSVGMRWVALLGPSEHAAQTSRPSTPQVGAPDAAAAVGLRRHQQVRGARWKPARATHCSTHHARPRSFLRSDSPVRRYLCDRFVGWNISTKCFRMTAHVYSAAQPSQDLMLGIGRRGQCFVSRLGSLASARVTRISRIISFRLLPPRAPDTPDPPGCPKPLLDCSLAEAGKSLASSLFSFALMPGVQGCCCCLVRSNWPLPCWPSACPFPAASCSRRCARAPCWAAPWAISCSCYLRASATTA